MEPGQHHHHLTLEIVEPDERIGWTGTQARHIWTIKPLNDGTLLATEESMDGWLTRALKVMTPRFLEESLNT